MQLLERQGPTDYVYFSVVVVCLFSIAVPAVLAVFFLQRQLEPSDSVLFGSTPIGEIMLIGPIALLSLAAAAALSRGIAGCIRRGFKMPTMDPFPTPPWAASIDWRLAGMVCATILIAVAGKGFGSYFCVTERGLFVRPPLEFSLRHYDWEDVASVTVQCRDAITRKRRRFSYVLGMSDGHYIDLSPAPGAQFAEAFESISSRLDSLSDVQYEFDISEHCCPN
jgi:hypothetical protein